MGAAVVRSAWPEPEEWPAVLGLACSLDLRAALDVMEASARLTGTRSAFTGERIDKIIRDLSLYLRQGAPDLARDRAAQAFLARDMWREDPLW